jgi:hypothetical protein
MSYPSNQSQCRKLTDSMVSKMEDRAEAYMGVGPCDGCPFTSTCVGPELFGLGHATRQLQDLQLYARILERSESPYSDKPGIIHGVLLHV